MKLCPTVVFRSNSNWFRQISSSDFAVNKLSLLTLLLRIHGLVLLCALVPIFFPFEWMNSIHQFLGLGELNQAPITHYLTRTLSLVYALHGAVCFTITFDIKKYLPLIRILAIYHGLFGAILLAIDLQAGMPVFWTVSEGPPIVGFAIFIYWFSNLCQKDQETQT